MKKSDKLTVLGGGLWGTVLAQQLARGGRRTSVVLWEYFAEGAAALQKSRRHPHIPGFRLDDAVKVTADLPEALAGASVLVFVLPSAFLRATAQSAAKALGGRKPVVVNASKGVEPHTLLTMGDCLERELSPAAVYTLSGPSFAREVARGVPTRLVLGGPVGPRARAIAALFDGGILRVTLSPDRRGVELGGSLKNVLAIGAGILDGLGGQGANTKAAFLIQGLDEMATLISACGGRRETVYGLSGLGDLIATGTSPESRNRAFGELLGKGETAVAAVKAIPTVVEGAEAAHSAWALARQAKVRTPLIDAIYGIVERGRPASDVMKALGFQKS